MVWSYVQFLEKNLLWRSFRLLEKSSCYSSAAHAFLLAVSQGSLSTPRRLPTFPVWIFLRFLWRRLNEKYCTHSGDGYDHCLMLLSVEDTPQPLNTEHVYTTGNPTKRQVPKSFITEVSVGPPQQKQKLGFVLDKCLLEWSGWDVVRCLSPVMRRVLTGLPAVKRRWRGLGKANLAGGKKRISGLDCSRREMPVSPAP